MQNIIRLTLQNIRSHKWLADISALFSDNP